MEGSISTAQLNLVLQYLLTKLNVIAIDVTEYNPFFDIRNIILSSIFSIFEKINSVWK